VRDDLGGLTDYRSCCCQLVDPVDPRPRLRIAAVRGRTAAWSSYRRRQCTSGLVATSEGQGAGRIHIHLSSVQVRASSAAIGCKAAAAAIRAIVGTLRATKKRDCPAVKQSRRRCPRPRQPVRRRRTPRGSRPQSPPVAVIECVSTAHRPPSQLADATPIDSARKATGVRTRSAWAATLSKTSQSRPVGRSVWLAAPRGCC
jgi:hypothetical protein